jgi:6-pyruvoyl-tetrahydropterin synthase
MKKTFRDFHFRARHHVDGKSPAAKLTHWHSYVVRFYFANSPDQDELVKKLEIQFSYLHGADLNEKIGSDTTDEALAEWFLTQTDACKVIVTNDSQRGAEAVKC